MGKFDGILLVTDLDGTLLTVGQTISKENREAIAYFESEGGRFSFVSGRIPRCQRPILEQLTPKVPVGVNNGMLYDANVGEWVDFEEISPDAFAMTEEIVRKFPDAGVIAMGKKHVYFSQRDDIGEQFRVLVGLSERYDPINRLPEPCCKVLLTYPAEKMDALKAAVDAHPLSGQFYLARSDARYYEIMPRGCTKGRALRRLAEYLGISPEKTVAVGDQENDIAMFREAKLGIAVANATSVAKNAADVVLDATNEQHAIAEIIRRLDQGELVL